MISTFYLVISVTVMLAVFRLAKLLGVRNKVVQKIAPLLSILELLLWTVIIFWSASIFLYNRSYYSVLVIMLAVLFTLMVTWFYLKDIVAGYIFRVRHNPIKGQILMCDTIHGSVRMLGLSQITVETERGHWLRIPYSSLVTRSLSLQSPRQIRPGETTLELNVYGSDNPAKMERMIKRLLAQSPWCIAAKPINIHFIPEHNKVKISFFLLNYVYVRQVKESLARCLGKVDNETGA